jgi:hypothetical protein
VALFFFGSTSTISQASVASSAEVLPSVKWGHSYKLGQSPTNPAGYFGISLTGFTASAGATPLVEGVDYVMDYDAGLFTLLEASTIAVNGAEVTVTYEVAASSRGRVISGSEPVEGAMLYLTKNPKGADCTFYMPYVKITPNGDYALKGDEWQQIPLSLEILKPEGKEAIYRDNLPVYA